MKNKIIAEAEKWVAIKGYEGIYEVSSWGRVRSLNRLVKGKYNEVCFVKGKRLNPIARRHGYLEVNLVDSLGRQKRKAYKIHRLVASAFIPNENNLPQVNHKDENKANNCVDNLEWCTCKYNVNYGTMPMRHKLMNRKPIIQKNPTTGESRYFPSITSALEYGFNRTDISRVLSGQKKLYKGFEWRYAA